MNRRRLLLLWLGATLALTLFPFVRFRVETRDFRWGKPLAGPAAIFDVVANVALFVPLGVLGRRRSCVPAAFLLSLLIELAQTRLLYRQPSYMDLLANTAGAALGLVCLRLPRVREAGPRRLAG